MESQKPRRRQTAGRTKDRLAIGKATLWSVEDGSSVECLKKTRSFFFRIEKFGEARIFQQKSEVFVVARVEAVGAVELDGDFQIAEGRVGFSGKAVESGERINDVVGFGSELARPVKTFPGIVPAAKVHHGHPALIVLFGGLGILLLRRLHALFCNFQMHASAVGELLARAFENLLQFLLGALKSLLMKMDQSLIVDFHLSLDARIDQLDAASLGRVGRR